MYIAVMRIRNTTQTNYVDELHGYLPSSIEVYNIRLLTQVNCSLWDWMYV